eukprot:6325168-Alexandrium_andersonii.AAC.1
MRLGPEPWNAWLPGQRWWRVRLRGCRLWPWPLASRHPMPKRQNLAGNVAGTRRRGFEQDAETKTRKRACF